MTKLVDKSSKRADITRRKNHSQLSKEEHQFISIDCVIFPEVYHSGFKPFPRYGYDLKLTKDRITSIIEAPAQLEQAMGYLETEIELLAHFIVNKFYERIENDVYKFKHEVESDVNENEIDVPKLSIKDARKQLHQIFDFREFNINLQNNFNKISYLIEQINGHFLAYTSQRSSAIVNIMKMEELAKANYVTEEACPFFIMDDIVQAYSVSSTQINENERKRHRFIVINDTTKAKPLALTISIVFHGSFDKGEYKPARLSTSFKEVKIDGSISMSTGIVPYHLQSLNTQQKLGRIIMHYEFEQFPCYETNKYCFEIEVVSLSECRYSVDVNCDIAHDAGDVIIDELWQYFNREREIKFEGLKVDNTKLDCRILETKNELVKKLANESNSVLLTVKHEIDLHENNLEVKAEIDLRSYIETSKALEIDFAKQCRLISIRKQAIVDINDAIEELLEKQKQHSNEVLQLTEQNRKCLEDLPRFCTALFGSTVSSYIEDILMRDTDEIDKEGLDSDEQVYVVKSRKLLREIDRTQTVKRERVASIMIHKMPQLFPKHTLQTNLQTEMNNVIMAHIMDEEKTHPLSSDRRKINDDEKSINSSELSISNDTLSDDEHIGEILYHQNRDQTGIPNNLCNACGGIPCIWRKPTNIPLLCKRRDNVSNTILSMKQKRTKIISTSSQYRSFRELDENRVEIKQLSKALDDIDDQLKVMAVDEELHKAFKINDKYFVVRSLHGYDTLMLRADAIGLLSSEHDRLVALLVARELMEDILNSMLRGWNFGNPVSQIRNQTNQIIQGHSKADNKIQMIGVNALIKKKKQLIFDHNKKSQKHLNQSEKSIKIGFVCLVLKYFNTLTVLREEKKRRRVDYDIDTTANSKKTEILSHERLKMKQEEENAIKRQSLVDHTNEKARRGAEQIRLKILEEATEKIRTQQAHTRKTLIKRSSVITIQRHYRGHIGRKAASRWAKLRQNLHEYNILCNCCAITISRVYRGHVGREIAAGLRRELTAYILSIREAEIKEEEEEYWDNLRFGEWRRKRFQRLRNT